MNDEYSTYGLSDKELSLMQQLFASNGNVERAVLYGSRAKGTFKEFSDIDITLVGSELTRTDLFRLNSSFHDSSLPYTVDLSIFAKLKNEQLIDHINRCGIVIYERK